MLLFTSLSVLFCDSYVRFGCCSSAISLLGLIKYSIYLTPSVCDAGHMIRFKVVMPRHM